MLAAGLSTYDSTVNAAVMPRVNMIDVLIEWFQKVNSPTKPSIYCFDQYK